MIKYFINNPMSIKIKKKDLIFFSFIVLFEILLLIYNVDLQGSLSIIFVALITFYFSRHYKSLATILYVALCVRLVLIFLGNFLVTLPDSWGDATLLEQTAWELSQDGFFEVFYKFPIDRSSYLLSWLLAFVYSLTDRSVIMGQSFSLLFGMGSILLGSRLTNKIWGEKISIKVGWILALYPTLVLYSCLILREAYVWFFLLMALYGIVSWSKDGSFKALLIIFIGFFGATFFHGAMFIGCFTFLAILLITSFIKIIKKFYFLKIPISSLAQLSVALICIIFFASISESIPKIGSLSTMFSIEKVIEEIINRNINSAAYPEWTIPKTTFEFMYKAPIRIIYFMLSPFPWDITKASHIFGLFDGMVHVVLLILFIKNFKLIWSDRSLRIIFIILISYLIVYGLASGNFGTGLRHRTKFIIILILMVAPWIPKIVFNKKQKNIDS